MQTFLTNLKWFPVVTLLVFADNHSVPRANLLFVSGEKTEAKEEVQESKSAWRRGRTENRSTRAQQCSHPCLEQFFRQSTYDIAQFRSCREQLWPFQQPKSVTSSREAIEWCESHTWKDTPVHRTQGRRSRGSQVYHQRVETGGTGHRQVTVRCVPDQHCTLVDLHVSQTAKLVHDMTQKDSCVFCTFCKENWSTWIRRCCFPCTHTKKKKNGDQCLIHVKQLPSWIDVDANYIISS